MVEFPYFPHIWPDFEKINAIDIRLPKSKYIHTMKKTTELPVIMELENRSFEPSILDNDFPLPKIKTLLTARNYPIKGEINTRPSMTIPDQSLSVKEIMQRYAQGMPLNGIKDPIYHGEDELIPDYGSMDLAEREALKSQIEGELITLKAKLIQEREQKAKYAPPLPPNNNPKAPFEFNPAQSTEPAPAPNKP